MENLQKRTWAEINLAHLEHNYRVLRALVPDGCHFMGMVKADGYGHGAVAVARRLELLGCEYLAVACLEEGIALRQAGLLLPILILGYTSSSDVEQLLRFGLTQTIYDTETAEAMSKAALQAGGRLKSHVKVDTGMARLGLFSSAANVADTAAEIARWQRLKGLRLEGIFTHFADADEDEGYTMGQLAVFSSLVDRLEQKFRLRFPIRHCANSAAMLQYPRTHFDMVRPGIALYGCAPGPQTEGRLDLRPVMTVKTRVAAVRRLPAGSTVSYGRTHTLQEERAVATLSMGYADGLFRACSNGLPVSIHGVCAPVIGRICMDMCMADVTGIPGVCPGDVATIFGYDGETLLPVEVGAALAGTISYELLCAISRRVPKIYL